jgi:hypothetical protein
MGFNMTGAMAGVLGGVADLGTKYQAKQDALESQRIQNEQEMRKEKAKMLRDKFMQEHMADRQSQLEQEKAGYESERDVKKHGWRLEEIEAEKNKTLATQRPSDYEQKRRDIENDKDLSISEKKDALRALRTGSTHDTADERKRQAIDKDETLTPEEKKEAKYGLGRREKLTDYQKMKLQEDLAKAEAGGIDESNVSSVNRMREQLGIPKLQKKVVKPGEDKWYKPTTKDQVEFVESAGTEPGAETQGSSGIDKYKAMLSGKQPSTIELSSGASAPPVTQQQQPGIVASTGVSGGLGTATKPATPSGPRPQDLRIISAMKPEQLANIKKKIEKYAQEGPLSPELSGILETINQRIAQMSVKASH